MNAYTGISLCTVLLLKYSFIGLITNTISSPDEKQTKIKIYLSPWNTIKPPAPNVLDFDKEGNVKKIPVPPENLIKTHTALPNVSQEIDRLLFSSHNYESVNITDYILKNMEKRIDTIYNKTGKNKKQVYTHCNEDGTICNFLMCPFVKQFCTLCIVNVKESSKKDDTTKCNTVLTGFLSTLYKNYLFFN